MLALLQLMLLLCLLWRGKVLLMLLILSSRRKWLRILRLVLWVGLTSPCAYVCLVAWHLMAGQMLH